MLRFVHPPRLAFLMRRVQRLHRKMEACSSKDDDDGMDRVLKQTIETMKELSVVLMAVRRRYHCKWNMRFMKWE